MKRFFLALAMAGILSSSALAGTIDTCGAPAPAPAPGDMDTAGAPAPGDMGNGLALLILDLIF